MTTHFAKKPGWFKQLAGWGLGNFITATPALRQKSEMVSDKIGVHFDSRALSTLYEKCEFIKILDSEPSTPPLATSQCPERRPNESDYEAFFRFIVADDIPMPPPYVDNDVTKELERESDRPHIAIFHGCYNDVHVSIKDLGAKTRQHIIDTTLENDLIPVILGDKSDKTRYWKEQELDNCVDFLDKLSLRDTVSILSQCDLFISNDTGLYHVAGALGIPGLVMWTKTDPIKNKSPSEMIQHAISEEADFDFFADQIDGFLSTMMGTGFQ